MDDKILKDTAKSVDLRVENARVQMLFEHLGEGLISYYAWILILFILLIIGEASAEILIFLAVIIVTTEIISERVRRSFHSLDEGSNPSSWEWKMVSTVLVTCLTVSGGVMLIIDANNELLLYTSFVLIVLPALMSVGFLVSSMRVQYAWVIGLILPLVVKTAMSDNMYYWVLGAAIFLSAFSAAVLIGKKMHNDFVRTLKLNFENADLLKVANSERVRAEKANADKMRFLAAASHDLRQPIHALELYTDALRHELNTDSQIELMERVSESTTAMNSLLYSLLDISKLDAGVTKVHKSNFYLKDLLIRMVQSIQPIADEKGIAIIFKETSYAVTSDPVLLESILHNLLSNAVKYTDAGSIEIVCETSKSGTVKLSIKDTGVGISSEDQEVIFDEFIQLANPERDRSKGLGLGLSIVKRTCILLGHRFEMNSALHEGSVFSLELNSASVDDIDLTEEESGNETSNATVLVIDDEVAILGGMEKMLSRWGYQVFTATSSNSALQTLENYSGQVDLIIADYRLTEGKLGTDAIKDVQRNLGDASIPSMIITGDTGSDQLQNLENKGYHVLHKPVAAMKLRAFMQLLLKQHKGIKSHN